MLPTMQLCHCVTSLEAIYQVMYSFLWCHRRLYTTFLTYAVVLACKQTWKIGGVVSHTVRADKCLLIRPSSNKYPMRTHRALSPWYGDELWFFSIFSHHLSQWFTLHTLTLHLWSLSYRSYRISDFWCSPASQYLHFEHKLPLSLLQSLNFCYSVMMDHALVQ